MTRVVSTKIILLAISVGLAPTLTAAQEPKSTSVREVKGKSCRMEQQCHWKNFKKICTYVKVCR